MIVKLLIKIFTLTSLLLYFELSYSNPSLDIDCYVQFSTRNKTVLKLPKDLKKRELLYKQTQLEPDKYAIPKNKETREKFFQFLKEYKELPYVSEIIFSFTTNKEGERIIKKAGVSFTKSNKALYQQSYVMPETKADSKLRGQKPIIRGVYSNESKLNSSLKKLKKLTTEKVLLKSIEIETKIDRTLERVKKEIKQEEYQIKKMTVELETIKKAVLKLLQSPRVNEISDWDFYEKRVEYLVDQLDAIIKKNQIKTLDELLNNSSLLLANHPYSITLENHKTYYIEFDNKVTHFLIGLYPHQRKLLLGKIQRNLIIDSTKFNNNSIDDQYKNNLLKIQNISINLEHLGIQGFIKDQNIRFIRYISSLDKVTNTLKIKNDNDNLYTFPINNTKSK